MSHSRPPCLLLVNRCLIALAVLAALSRPYCAFAENVAPAPAPPAGSNSNSLDSLLDLADKDPAKLSEVAVQPSIASSALNSNGASNTLDAAEINATKATSTGDLLKQIPSVSGRRLSGINIDPRVRGYNSAQLNANADGMTQRRSIQDIDSLLSQIDPGVIQEVTVIDGPYTSLYGPGFAFINVDLIAPRRYDRPEMHSATTFNYGSNGQSIYGREMILGGGKEWGLVCTYGVRSANDYRAGGDNSDWLVPSSYKRWDTMLSLSYDVTAYSRIEFEMLHNELNDVKMPGVIYDLENSTDNQYNLRYIVQEDRNGPQQLVLQSWHQETFFFGNGADPSKQAWYQDFITPTLTYEGYEAPTNTLSNGYSVSTGIRCLRTFGQEDTPQWTVGADWRRFEQRYQERDVNALGVDVLNGEIFGNPEARMDDVGVLTNLKLPVGDRLSFNLGGRVDYASTWLNVDDPIVVTGWMPAGNEMPTYTLGMAYAMSKVSLNDHDTLSVGTGFAMRAPDLTELYTNEPYVPVCGFGNSYCDGYATMSPEKNWQFDLGLSSKRGPFRYGARGFYATIWDYIETIPFCIYGPDSSTHVLGRNFSGFSPSCRYDVGLQAENGDICHAEYQTYNIPLATMAGGDLFGEMTVRPGLTVFGCMSYVHGENVHPLHMIDDGSGNYSAVPNGRSEPLPGIYPFNGRISARFFDPEKDKWGIEFIARLVHSQEEVATSLSELPTPGFCVYDLKGYYRVRENLRVSLALENLLNRDYYEPGSLVYLNSAGVPTFLREPGFSAILGVEAKF
ncbi:MAG: TonB-dependent receptor [Planctomycetaceae bacterium]|nr:TonB-dependent receptor [Planctomycetaceae bacterium]